MPENAVELDENEQINIFSKLLVKNLIVHVVEESAAAEPGQTHVPLVADEATVEAEIPIVNDENITEAKAVAAPCPKCKGTGKTNLMGGARGLSFMKRQCKYCSSGTAAQAAKAGA